MKINWTVRLKNKAFWIAIIPAVTMLTQQVCKLFGVSLDITGISEQLSSIVTTLFAVLTLMGVVNDPTTAGMKDSDRAMTYTTPN